MTDVNRVRELLAVDCPNCQARAGDQCTAPTDDGRRALITFHSARGDAADEKAWTMPTTAKFYVTFGQQYHTEAHPKVDWAHPDGWFEVTVPFNGSRGAAEDAARERVFKILGKHWSNIVPAHYWSRPELYPLGALAECNIDGFVVVHHRFKQTMVEVGR